MKSVDSIKDWIQSVPVETDQQTNQVVLDGLFAELEQTTKITRTRTWRRIGRFIMKTSCNKQAAAILLCAGLLSTLFLFHSESYALEQSIEACNLVRSVHIKNYWLPHEEPIEAWLEFDANGVGQRARVNMPLWADPQGQDGAKRIVWEANKFHLYLEKKNFYFIMSDTEVGAMIFSSIEQLYPQNGIQALTELEASGLLELTIEEPSDKTSPIVVTGTLLGDIPEVKPANETEKAMAMLIEQIRGSELEINKFVVRVDPLTKLVLSLAYYEERQGQDHCVARLEYYNYNQPIAEELFDLENEIPSNAMKVDETTMDIGLAQGDLSDEEIIKEVARQFLQALIDQDYAKAGQLYGVPADRIRKVYSRARFIRIISIGTPVHKPWSGGHYVPCTVEYEQNGKLTQLTFEHAYVRKVHGQPHRWEITGGFWGVARE